MLLNLSAMGCNAAESGQGIMLNSVAFTSEFIYAKTPLEGANSENT